MSANIIAVSVCNVKPGYWVLIGTSWNRITKTAKSNTGLGYDLYNERGGRYFYPEYTNLVAKSCSECGSMADLPAFGSDKCGKCNKPDLETVILNTFGGEDDESAMDVCYRMREEAFILAARSDRLESEAQDRAVEASDLRKTIRDLEEDLSIAVLDRD